MAALVLSTGAGFVAGLILSHITGSLERLPGLLVLIPAAVGMRGTIFGALEARLGTSIHTGLFQATLRRGGVLRDNVMVAIVTTLTSSLWLAMLARSTSTLFGDPSISLVQLIVISVVGGALGSVVILAFTVGLSIVSFRRGWDLDAVGTPMVTALGDAATLPTLFLASLLVESGFVTAAAAVACVGAAAWSVVAAMRSDRSEVRRIVLQMIGVIALTPLLDIAAGGLLGRFQSELVRNAGILILIPPLVSQSGALGGILASRLSSKIQVGLVHPSLWPEALAWADAAIVSVLAVVTFLVVGSGATVLADLTTRTHPGALEMVGGTLLAGLLLLPVLLTLSYAVAVATARLGLDPDDQSVPVITSCMDLAGVVAVLVVMSSLGVLPG
ncbi:MAG: magnesium transporter [Actinomycetota bacterium]